MKLDPTGNTARANLDAITNALPDVRVWVIIGFFVLAYKLLNMVEHDPGLLKDAAFMSLAVLVIGSGGLGSVAAYLFGGTKVGGDVMKAQTEAVIASAPPAVNPDPNAKPTVAP